MILEGVLNAIEPYKSGKKKNNGENPALRAASENVVRAIKLTEQILLRDKAYKARKKSIMAELTAKIKLADGAEKQKLEEKLLKLINLRK